MRPDIKAILARHKAARSGAWAHWDARVYPVTEANHPDGPGVPDTTLKEICDTSNSRQPQANAEFIAHAKTDVMDLINYIDELERKLDGHKTKPIALDPKTERALASNPKRLMPCGCAWGTLLCPH
jgi:hypothetical protein